MRNVCILIAILCFCQPAGAQKAETKFAQERAQGRIFIEVYFNYMNAVNTRGMEGLKTMTAPDFTLKWRDQAALTGDKAFAELKKLMPDPTASGGSEEQINAVKLRRLVLAGDQAFVQTEEIHSLHSKDSAKYAVTASWKMLFKQTWRKTAQGWRLALWEKGTEKLSGYVSAVTYTVSWHSAKPDAAPVTNSVPDKK